MTMRQQHSHRSRRGVSLIEALVALAVMAFGMLSLVGVQATLRLNSDVASQRTAATRIASEEMERLRGFAEIKDDTAPHDYSRIRTGTVTINVGNNGVSTAFSATRTVNTLTAPPRKEVRVAVTWTDRTGTAQSVVLDSVIAGVAPALSSMLSTPKVLLTAINQIEGRNATIPRTAVDQLDGTSLFTPPGSTGVSWYFNNLTGLICAGASTCANPATLVSGTVRYDLKSNPRSEQPQGEALNLALGPNALVLVAPVPASPAPTTLCYSERFSASQLADRTGVNYFCAVTAPVVGVGWGGQLNVRPVDQDEQPVAFGSGSGEFRVYRYTRDVLDDFTENTDHPRTYCLTTPPPNPVTSTYTSCLNTRVKANLINQNFLVIRGDRSSDLNSSTTVVNGTVRLHQP